MVSAIQQAEKQDQLAQDADKIESLLSQMSDKISNSSKPKVESHWPSFSVILFVALLILAVYFYFQSEDGRKAWLKLRMMLNNGRPFLKRGLDVPFSGEEVPL
eukprot:g11182.t1